MIHEISKKNFKVEFPSMLSFPSLDFISFQKMRGMSISQKHLTKKKRKTCMGTYLQKNKKKNRVRVSWKKFQVQRFLLELGFHLNIYLPSVKKGWTPIAQKKWVDSYHINVLLHQHSFYEAIFMIPPSTSSNSLWKLLAPAPSRFAPLHPWEVASI